MSELFRIDGRDTESFFGALQARTQSLPEGSDATGGVIRVLSESVELERGGQISTTSFQDGGDAGEVILNAEELFIGSEPGANGAVSGVFAHALEGSRGVAGRIRLAAGTAEVRGGVRARQISVDIDQLNLSDRGRIDVSGESGGLIAVRSQAISLSEDSGILANVGGELDAPRGQIRIRTGRLVGADNGDITANAEAGIGGTIRIQMRVLEGIEVRDQLTNGSDITAFGPDGQGLIDLNVQR